MRETTSFTNYWCSKWQSRQIYLCKLVDGRGIHFFSPNKVKDPKTGRRFNDAKYFIPNHKTDAHIIGGDFKCVVNAKTDRHKNGPVEGEKQHPVTIFEFSLEVIWRRRHPSADVFFFSRNQIRNWCFWYVQNILISKLHRPNLKQSHFFLIMML